MKEVYTYFYHKLSTSTSSINLIYNSKFYKKIEASVLFRNAQTACNLVLARFRPNLVKTWTSQAQVLKLFLLKAQPDKKSSLGPDPASLQKYKIFVTDQKLSLKAEKPQHIILLAMVSATVSCCHFWKCLNYFL